MKKQNIKVILPVLLVAFLLIRCWLTICITDVSAVWKHYAALILFVALVAGFYGNTTRLTLALGVYLLLATFNLLAFTPTIRASWITINTSTPVSTPPVQLLSLGLFVLYFILNLDTLIEMQLNYKEKRANKKA